MAPCSRMRRVSARVSMPATPTMPRAVSQSTHASGQVRVPGRVLDLAHDDGPGMGLVRLEQVLGGPVVADHGVGEGDHLAVVGGVGDDLLVAGHAGVEDDLAQHLALRRRSRSRRRRCRPASTT